MQEIILDKTLDDIFENKRFLKIPALVFNPHRLLILTILVRFGALDFPALRDGVLLKKSDGRLANHLRVLEELKLLEIKKSFVDRKPKTYYTLSTEGKELIREIETQLTNIFDVEKR